MGNEQFPPQRLEQPAETRDMKPTPIVDNENYKGSGKLQGKIALITGGDSGIGSAVAIAFAKEGASIVISFLEETEDAQNAKKAVEKYNGECLTVQGDIGVEENCKSLIQKTIERFGKLDILVNNAAEQHENKDFATIDTKLVEKTFRTNILSMFYLTKAAMPYLKEGSCIINTTSVTAYKGHPLLVDYSSTKGAILAFTRALSAQLIEKGIRVNGVAPGPIWTPLIPGSFEENEVATFGSDTPMGRAGQPYECAPAFVFLASEDSTYFTGQVLHPNGGQVVNG